MIRIGILTAFNYRLCIKENNTYTGCGRIKTTMSLEHTIKVVLSLLHHSNVSISASVVFKCQGLIMFGA
jgi:hypothetical protein